MVVLNIFSILKIISSLNYRTRIKFNLFSIFEDRVHSMSRFAMELLGYKRFPQGPLYFKYEDEILDDRHRRMDGE